MRTYRIKFYFSCYNSFSIFLHIGVVIYWEKISKFCRLIKKTFAEKQLNKSYQIIFALFVDLSLSVASMRL